MNLTYVIFIDFAEHKDLLNVNNGSGALAAGQISSKLLELLEIFRSFGYMIPFHINTCFDYPDLLMCIMFSHYYI